MIRETPLEERVGRALISRRSRLAVAESCTGGLLSARLTAMPGSSRYFLGGILAYHNRVKVRILGVPSPLLRRHGAVSAPCAVAMAHGARRALWSDFALSITGIAGPGGATAAKPVGLIFIALAGRRRTRWRRAVFSGDRGSIREQAAALALNLLYSYIEDEE